MPTDEEMLIELLPAIRAIAGAVRRRLPSTHVDTVPFDDLYQEAALAAWLSLCATHDLDGPTRAMMARNRAAWGVLDYLRSIDNMARWSRAKYRRLQFHMQRGASVSESASAIGISAAEAHALCAYATACQPYAIGGEVSEEFTYHHASAPCNAEAADYARKTVAAVESLPARLRRVLDASQNLGGLSEAARSDGVSGARFSQLLKRARHTVARALGEPDGVLP